MRNIVWTRIDDRLIHGAVGFSWTKQLSINMIILANDAIAKDDFQKMTLDIAKPRGTKLVCESVEKAKALIRTHLKSSTNVMVITNNIPDAADILTSIPEIGSLKNAETKENLIGAIAVSQKDIELCNKLVSDGFEVELRLIPDGKKTYFKDYKLQ